MADVPLPIRRSLTKACDRCRARKVRCSVDTGFERCNQCRRLGVLDCSWSQRKKPRRKTRLEKEEEARRGKIAASAALDPTHAALSPLQIVQHESPSDGAMSTLTPTSNVVPHSAPSLEERDNETPPAYSGDDHVSEQLNPQRPQTPGKGNATSVKQTQIPKLYIDGLLEDPMASDRRHRDQSQPQPQALSACYTEPTALTLPDLCGGTNLSLAFLSKRRLNALSARLGHQRLQMLVETIESLINTKMKTVDKVPPQSTIREMYSASSPDVGADAMRYIQSYFEQVHPLYPFLDRKMFEDRAFSPQLAHQLATDKSWSALYHAVLAIGSQYHNRGGFEPGKSQAWKYFEITFSLCPDLLIFKASLTTVQALTAMAVFARNISCIQLESITVSQAARMAQSLGYNRATASSDKSIQRTFWVLYCMEKTTCFYTGKTSLLSDHDIGFAPPSLPEPAFGGFDWLVTFSRYGRLVSRIYANLFAINAAGKPPAAYYAIIDELRGELEAWRDAIPERFRPGGAFRVRDYSGPPATTLAIFVQYLYFSVLLALSRGTLHVAKTNEEQGTRHQEAKKELMQTARRILELSRHIEVEPFSHVWVLVFMPLSALFILFDFVVHNPVHPETNNNLALLDIAGGHFSHLEYVSQGTLPASLAAEFAHIARQYVQDFRMQQYQRMKGLAMPPVADPSIGASHPTPATTAMSTPPRSVGEDLWRLTGVMRASEHPQSNETVMPQTNQNPGDGSAPSYPGLEYTDPLVFSLGDDDVSAPTDSELGIDIMDLFDVELSDIWSLSV